MKNILKTFSSLENLTDLFLGSFCHSCLSTLFKINFGWKRHKFSSIFILATILIFPSCTTTTEEQDKKAILKVLDSQQLAWSKHDLDGFMKGYWKSDSLKFYGSKGITYGWDKTLENYKKGYPTSDHSGQLKFKINDISRIERESYYIMGEYYLTRKVGNINGIFMIIFRKIDGEWKIVADTSA